MLLEDDVQLMERCVEPGWEVVWIDGMSGMLATQAPVERGVEEGCPCAGQGEGIELSTWRPFEDALESAQVVGH
jgi:hypothetical protein